MFILFFIFQTANKLCHNLAHVRSNSACAFKVNECAARVCVPCCGQSAQVVVVRAISRVAVAMALWALNPLSFVKGAE